ncbi:PGF-pre-PGF domain-containing protein [uncultured Methanolobus sp.]|uniref:PGF-pre-PGF domain-containing protein n=1 Tax=uncultured Methanolobus sp. TaxID=218300 RepID=UPI002AABB4BE|nr:PGF-pre-PGF domain-containing protein [uncultured Methanolobus sp.]
MNRILQVPEYAMKTPPVYHIIATALLLCILILPASASSVVSIEKPTQEVHAGDDFHVNVNITPATAIAGAQIGLNFDSNMLTVNSIEEGNFFDRDNIMSIFISGTVDNQQGTVSGLFAVTLGQNEIDSSGCFAHVTLTAGDQAGETTISLSNVILSDSEGNAIPTTTENTQVTITGTPASSSTETASAAGSGGGGGGGGDTGESAENIELKEVNKLYITGNTDVTYTFDNSNNPVKAIRYTSLKNAGFISSTIEILKDVSTTVSEKPEGLIYRNINIWIGKAGYATESNMEDMKISFAVLKKWVQVNDVEISDIRLNRYHDDRWQVLEAEMTGEDDDFYFFEAITPGFSPFAITANVADMADEIETENKTVNAAASYDDNDLQEQIEEIEVEDISDDTSTFITGKTGSAKLSQNSILLILVSMSFVVLLRRREKL